MERLLTGKIYTFCANRACLARVSKPGRSYCAWKSYVNYIGGEFRNMRCSCMPLKQLRREFRAVRNCVNSSSHVLRIRTQDDREWILLRPKHTGKEQRRESSSDSGDDREQDAWLNIAGISLSVMVVFGLLWTILHYPGGRIPRHVRWEEFEREYLMKGRVRSITVYGSAFGKNPEVPFVMLYPSAMANDREIIVDTNYAGDFRTRLQHFEQNMQVPVYERIPVKTVYGLHYAESPLLYTLVIGGMGLLAFLSMIAFSQSLRRLSPEYLKRKFRDAGEMKEKINKQQIRKTKYEEEMQRMTDKMDEEKQAKGKENFADLVRERLFQDRGFKIKRGDIIMKNQISMKDVAGLHEPKVEILEFVDYVKHPERFQRLGAKTPRGALLLGPPGCGKTLLAKALAAECGVPFYFVAASELDDMIVGVGSQRVRTLFKKAREQAPCIIYIDELDAIGMRRPASDKAASRSSNDKEMTLNQLLAELDGMHSREGVIILASTNRADMLDKALLRPGRFDRHITIDLPTFKERIELFDLYLTKLSLMNPVSTYSTRLAQLTPGMSGADIAYICNEAAIHAAREKRKKVMAKDFEYAVERKIAGAARATNTIGTDEKKVIAYHESGHALVGWLLEHTDALLKVTIVPRTSGVGGFAQYLPKENKLYSKEHLFDMMCMALGGRVAETVIFNHLSTGAQDDLRRVTKMAYAQIRNYGMSESFGLLSYPEDQYGLKPFSKKVANMLDLEARQLVTKAHKHTEELLKNNKDKLHQMAALLLERETISARDVEKLIGPPPYGEKQMIDPLHFYEDELLHEELQMEDKKSSSDKKKAETDEKKNASESE